MSVPKQYSRSVPIYWMYDVELPWYKFIFGHPSNECDVVQRRDTGTHSICKGIHVNINMAINSYFIGACRDHRDMKYTSPYDLAHGWVTFVCHYHLNVDHNDLTDNLSSQSLLMTSCNILDRSGHTTSPDSVFCFVVSITSARRKCNPFKCITKIRFQWIICISHVKINPWTWYISVNHMLRRQTTMLVSCSQCFWKGCICFISVYFHFFFSWQV